MIDYTNKVFQGHCPEVLSTLPDNIVNCCVTSPPYYGLRNYGTDPVYFPEVRYRLFNFMPEIVVPEMTCNLGLEDSPEAFVGHIVYIFRQVYRVLKNDGTLWLNFGDSYWGGKGASSQAYSTAMVGKRSTINAAQHQIAGKGETRPTDGKHDSIKPKDLIGIPWMIAFALRSDDWYLRQDIIWHKPNPMPESVTDRCTKSHEYIFLLSKSKNYYFDAEAIRTQVKDSTVQRMMQQIEDQKGSERVPGKTNGTMKDVWPGRTPKNGVDIKGGNHGSELGIKAYSHRGTGDKKLTGHSGNYDSNGDLIGNGMANKKSVWTVTTKPFKDAHFATFPEDLIVDCIKAGCPEGGIVLDPFGGSMTTAATAKKLNRNYISVELNHKYIVIGEKRFHNEFGIFK